MSLPDDLKPLFVEWLQEAAIDATKKGSKVALLYNKALDKLRSFENPINDPRTLRSIQFVGAKTVEYLSAKLKSHCVGNGFPIPSPFDTSVVASIDYNRKRVLMEAEDTVTNKKTRKQKQYVPRQRSGGYAILIALYLRDKQRDGLSKDEIVQTATPYSDKSFKSNPTSNEFYSAWNSIKILLKHDLVSCSGRSPKTYFLTDEGLELAKNLTEAEGLNSSPLRNNTADLSFDNQVRVSPDTSLIKSSKQLHSPELVVHTSKQKTKSTEGFGTESDVNTSRPFRLDPSCDRSKTSNSSNNIILLSSSPRPSSSPLKPLPGVYLNSNKNFGNKLEREKSNNIEISSKVHDATYSNSITLESSSRIATTASTLSSIHAVSNVPQLIHDVTNRIYDSTRYDIWTADEYEIILIVDNREVRSQQERDFFQNRLESFGVKCEIRPLSIGDSLWIARRRKTGKEVVLDYICERKKLDDLALSIKDGRFQEQKNRLKKTGMKHFYYLVEEGGVANYDRIGEMSEAIQTAISMTMTVSNFYIKRSRIIEDTIAFLASLTNVIRDHFTTNRTNLIVLKPRSIKNQAEYGELLKKFRNKFENRSTPYQCVHLYPTFQEVLAKTGMMTVKEMFILMLMAVRGVSLERAITIQNYFQTPRRLLDFYHIQHKHTSESEKKKLLMNLFKDQIGNKKIGKVVSEKIYDIWGSAT